MGNYLIKTFLFICLSVSVVSCGNEKTVTVSPDGQNDTVMEGPAPIVSLHSILAGAESGRYRPGEIIVRFKSGVRSASSLETHRKFGSKVLRRLSFLNADHVKLPHGVTVREGIIRYMQDPEVEYAEPNYIRSVRSTVPNDPLFKFQWDMTNTIRPGVDIGMSSAWDIVRGKSGLVVAVLDTGIDYTHPDLAQNIWANPGEPSCGGTVDTDRNGYAADCRGWNFVSGNNNPMDDSGHGTHVSGIIGAVGDNGLGIAGVIWDVRIMPLKILDAEGAGTVSDEIAAIDYAIVKGARIINASFEGDSSSKSNAEMGAISAADSAGILFVTAAGNGDEDGRGSNNDSVAVYPGNYALPNILSVAATYQSDSLASFSNFGPNTVHVAAPGVSILSTVPAGRMFCGGSPASGYELCDGTSMATPHVTGVAGLVSSYYEGLSPLQLKAMIMRYVDTLPKLQELIKSGGRINAYKAVSSLLAPSQLSADALSPTQVVLSWADNATGEDGYKIERMPQGGVFAEVTEAGPGVTTFTDSGLDPSTEYTYRVRAFNSIPVYSAYSNEASVATHSGQGPTPTPVSSGGGGCSIGAKRHSPGDSDIFLVLLPPVSVLGAVCAHKRRKRCFRRRAF